MADRANGIIFAGLAAMADSCCWRRVVPVVEALREAGLTRSGKAHTYGSRHERSALQVLAIQSIYCSSR